jgi:hypothetical protein
MKKLTVLLLAAALISGGVDAQSCCKKGHCTKACSKDKKATTNAATSKTAKADAPKKTS